jgi:hypothetical protein
MTGMERRKENSAALFLEIARNRPIPIVQPDLDIPGIMAIAWAHPIIKEKKMDRSPEDSFVNLVSHKNKPVRMSIRPTTGTFEKMSSNLFSNINPTTAAGIEPTRIYTSSLRYGFSR